MFFLTNKCTDFNKIKYYEKNMFNCVMYYWETWYFLSRRVWRYKKGLSESITRRGTDNTMTKRKSTNIDLQNTTQKTRDRGTGNWLFYESLYTELFPSVNRLYSILMAVSENLLLIISISLLETYSRLCEITLLNTMSV